MSFFIATLYLCAAAAMFYVLYFRLTTARLVLVALAIVSAIEEQQWFLPLIAGDDVINWQVTGITSFFAASWTGLDGPTTLGHLAVVAIGRLMALLGVFYAGVLLVKRGGKMATVINAQSLPVLMLLGLWGACAILSLALQVFVPNMLPGLEAVTRLGAAVGCVLYASYDLTLFIRQQPVSLRELWTKVKQRLIELQSSNP